MIPEYRLLHHLLKLKSNNFFKKEIKKQLVFFSGKEKNPSKKLIFNKKTNIAMFNKIISTFLYLNKISYKENALLITHFRLLISALSPIFNSQQQSIKEYQKIKAKILSKALENKYILNWYEKGQEDTDIIPEFLVNKKIPKAILNDIQILIFVTNCIFTHLINHDTYEFGQLLMLFYLLDLETRQTLKVKDNTNWNLKSKILYQDLFLNKLLIIDKLIEAIMKLETVNFNLYIRIMNFSLLGSYE